MKKLIVALGIIVGIIAWASMASAHVPTVTANCDGLVATGTDYNPQFTNTVKIVMDSHIVLDETFTTHFSSTTANPDPTAAHTYSVVIVGGDGVGNVDTEGTIPACEVTDLPPPTTTPSTTTTLPVPTTTTVAPARAVPPATVVIPTPVTVTAHFTG